MEPKQPIALCYSIFHPIPTPLNPRSIASIPPSKSSTSKFWAKECNHSTWPYTHRSSAPNPPHTRTEVPNSSKQSPHRRNTTPSWWLTLSIVIVILVLIETIFAINNAFKLLKMLVDLVAYFGRRSWYSQRGNLVEPWNLPFLILLRSRRSSAILFSKEITSKTQDVLFVNTSFHQFIS